MARVPGPPGSPDGLGFTPRPAVRWLAPRELARTAAIVAASSVVAGYWDKRELQAGLPGGLLEVPPDEDGGLWLDYTADTGDGFDATCTVASLLAAGHLDVPGAGRLPRGRLLVLGGDEVYPTPSPAAYEDRLRGPFRSALPEGPTQGTATDAPLLLAVPGNHDWYDGLTAWLRVFAQGRRVGGWRTAQTRSYFAVRLPQRWWLVGLDAQEGSDLDAPQVAYFREHLTAHLRPGDGVVLCGPVPTWAHSDADPTAFDTLAWFEARFVRPAGAQVRLWLSGDSHHYARFAEAGTDAPRQAVTCGLGGAFLSGTHDLPERLTLPPPVSRVRPSDPAPFTLAATYPDRTTSRRLRWGALSPGPGGLARRNPGFWGLAGAVHAVGLLALAGVLGLAVGTGPAQALRTAGVGAAAQVLGQGAVWFAVVVAVVSLAPLVRGRPPRPVPAVLVGAGLQGVVAGAGLLGAAAVPWPGAGTLPDWALLGLCVLGSVVVTGLAASWATALFLALGRGGLRGEWQMSAQAVEDRKGFLRLHVRPDGALVVHPVVVDTVCRSWRAVPLPPGAGDQAATRRLVPADGLPAVRLVEEPVVVLRSGVSS